MATKSATSHTGRDRLSIVVAVLALLIAGFLFRNYLFDINHFRASSRALSPESVGWAGIGWDAASPADIAAMGVPYALKLTQVAPTGPADAAGLMTGDFVTTINGSTFRDAADFQSRASGLRPGQAVRLGIVRNGAATTITVTLGDWSDVKDLSITTIGL